MKTARTRAGRLSLMSVWLEVARQGQHIDVWHHNQDCRAEEDEDSESCDDYLVHVMEAEVRAGVWSSDGDGEDVGVAPPTPSDTKHVVKW